MSGEIIAALAAAFTAGLFGSLHCIGMCGPLVSLGCRSQPSRNALYGPSLFIAGKLLSYALLGALAGWIGGAIASGIASRALERTTAYVAIGGGGLMIGMIVLSRLPLATGPLVRLSASVAKWSLRLGDRASFALGFGAALLPCGLLYAMAARSVAAAEPLLGAVLMIAFGLGTSPALFGIGSALRAIPQRWSKFGNVAGEIVLLITAAVLIWRGVIGLMAAAGDPGYCH